jgi:hypothetical protein
MPSDILIVPNRSSTTTAPIIQFSGSQANTIRLEVLTSGSIAFLGKSGSLFSISDNLSGSLMAVSDISGLPIFEVLSDDRVVMGKYNTNALVVTGSNVGIGMATPSQKLEVSGNIKLTTGGYIYGDTTLPYVRLNQTNGAFLGYDTTSVLSLMGSVTTLSAGSSYLGFITNGSERVRVTSDGNFSIGTTVPLAKLHVQGDLYTSAKTASFGQFIVGAGPNNLQVFLGSGLPFGNTGTGTIAIGHNALSSLSGAIGYNIAIGYSALYNLTSGTDNIAIGLSTMLNNKQGKYNVSVGNESFTVLGNTVGSVPDDYNTGIGSSNGNTIRSGSYNNFIGSRSGQGFLSGSFNTFLGSMPYGTPNETGLQTGSFNTIIGSNITTLSTVLNRTLVLADGSGSIRWYTNSDGNTAIGKTSPINAKLDINGDTTITGSLRVTGDVVSSNTSNILHPFLFITFL